MGLFGWSKSLIFIWAYSFIGSVAHGNGLDFDLMHAPAATDGFGHCRADVDDAAAVERAAVAHPYLAAFAGSYTGDPHHAGQGQGAVGCVFATFGQALTHGAYGAAVIVN